MGTWALVLVTNGVEGVLQFGSWSVRVRDEVGTGMPPAAIVAPNFVYQESVARPRVLLLDLTPRLRAARLAGIREQLAVALAPDAPVQRMYLRYTGATRTVQIPVVYAPLPDGTSALDRVPLV